MFYKQKKSILVFLTLTLLIASMVLSPVKPTNVQASAGWECQYLLPNIPLNDVWGSSPSDVFAVGGYLDNDTLLNSGVILHYDGNTWSEMECGTTAGFNVAFNNVWGSSPSDVFAVGNRFDKNIGLSMGVIFHYDGNTWSEMECGTTPALDCVWGSSSSDVFAAGVTGYVATGVKGTVLHYDGNTWDPMDLGTSTSGEEIESIWGASGSDVFAVGEFGLIIHYDGNSWNRMYSPIPTAIMDICGCSSSDVFAVGTYGDILHYDGGDWSKMECDNILSLMGILGCSSSDVFAVGTGTILHYDGNTWEEMECGTKELLWDIWGTSSDVFAVGAWGSGIILHYSRVVEMVYEIDIKPGSYSNPVNTKSRGVIPVAILGSSELDVESIDYTSLELYFGPELGVDGAEPKHNINSKKVFMSHIADVNDDLIPDLVVHFPVQDAGFAKRDEVGYLWGDINDSSFHSSDAVRIVK